MWVYGRRFYNRRFYNRTYIWGSNGSLVKKSIAKLNLVVYKFDTNWSGASIALDTAEHFTEKDKMKTIIQWFMK